MDGSNFVLHLYLMVPVSFLWAGAHLANECLLRTPGWQEGGHAQPPHLETPEGNLVRCPAGPLQGLPADLFSRSPLAWIVSLSKSEAQVEAQV